MYVCIVFDSMPLLKKYPTLQNKRAGMAIFSSRYALFYYSYLQKSCRYCTEI